MTARPHRGPAERTRRVLSSIRSWTRDPGGVVTLGLGLMVLAYLAWQVFGWGGPERRTLISDVAFVPVGFAGIALAWRAAKHRSLDARTRRAWFVVGAALAFYWAGDVLWSWFENTTGEPPFPSIADAFYLGFYPLLLVGLMLFPTKPRSKNDRMKFWLDAGTVLLGGWMIVWYFVLGPTALDRETSLVTNLVSIAYPVGDLVLLFGVTAVMLRRPAEGARSALGVFAGALVLFVIADLAFGYLSLKDSYVGGDWPDTLWMVAQFMMVVAAQVQHRNASRKADDERTDTDDIVRFSRAPYLVVGISFLLLILVSRRQAVYPLGGLLLGAVGVTALVVWRQIATLRENVRLLDELHELAVTDALTGLPNRRHFFDTAEREFYRARRYDRPLSAIMFDVDHFKRINDSSGHGTGDEVLRHVGELVRSSLRAGDLVARYGGDEFVVLLPETRTGEAFELAERLRETAHEITFAEGTLLVTLSIGVASAEGCADLNALLAHADEALYQAKRAGRDCARVLAIA